MASAVPSGRTSRVSTDVTDYRESASARIARHLSRFEKTAWCDLDWQRGRQRCARGHRTASGSALQRRMGRHSLAVSHTRRRESRPEFVRRHDVDRAARDADSATATTDGRTIVFVGQDGLWKVDQAVAAGRRSCKNLAQTAPDISPEISTSCSDPIGRGRARSGQYH